MAERTAPGNDWGTVARRVLLHVGMWTGFIALLILPSSGREDAPPLWPTRVLYGLQLIVMCAPPAYAHFALIDRYFLAGRRVLHVALLAVVVVVWAAAFGWVTPLWPGPREPFAARVVVILVVVVFSSSFKLLGVVGRQRTLIEEARTKQAQSELALLRAQLHPHFLFNTLNNLFGLARRGAPAAADGIAKLAHLLRYQIYDSSADLVDLEREAEQLRRFVDLERLRFSEQDDIDVSIQVEPGVAGTQVPPMLLIPFVENAFKHGVRRSAPSFVHVSLGVREGIVRFLVENSRHPARAAVGEPAAGIGLQNTRRRLDLLCPSAHQLSVGPEEHAFRVELTIDTTRLRGAR